MNKAILMGRMTRDPEIRYSNGPEQTAVGRKASEKAAKKE